MGSPRGFIELQAEESFRTETGAPAAAALAQPPNGKARGVRGACARIPPLAQPLVGSCACGLVLLLVGALAPEDTLPRVLILDCWTYWAWTYVIFFPVWLCHLVRVLSAGLRATARFGLARGGVAPREPGEHPEPALVLGWVPLGDALLLVMTWLMLGCASTWSWNSRSLPIEFFARPVTPSQLIFPRNFSWGAATAAYQVEGGLNNTQWYRFEQEFKHADGSPAIAGGWQCGLAADSWNRFDEDLECIAGLGIKTYRLSVEWSRIEPKRGEFNATAMARYVRWTQQLRSAGVEPLVTLHHFTEPLWRTDMGGLANASMADDFERYVRYVAAALAPTVDFWVTVNEIMVVSAVGYLNGDFPPGHSNDMPGMLSAAHTMVEMHRAAYRALHAVDTVAAPGGQGRPCLVSVAQNVVMWRPANTWSPTESFLAGLLEGFYNRWILERLLRARPERGGPLGPRGSGLDYLGLNHYFSQVVSLGGVRIAYDGRYATSDMDWPLEPGSLHEVVVQYAKWAPGLPIVITEHGCADGQVPDARRVEFLQKSLLGLQAAISDAGVPVIGYIHWALIDKCARSHAALLSLRAARGDRFSHLAGPFLCDQPFSPASLRARTPRVQL